MQLPDPIVDAIAICGVISARAQSLVALCDRISGISDIDHVKYEAMDVYGSEMKQMIEAIQSNAEFFRNKVKYLG